MPVIRVVRLESDPESEFPAAAVMARMLASAAKPIREVPPNHLRIERTLPGNPNGLTVDQHVFPLCSMQAFVGPVKRVSLFEMSEGKSRRVKPKNVVFCAERAWDQRTEGVLMKQIEDEFQDIVQPCADRPIRSRRNKSTRSIACLPFGTCGHAIEISRPRRFSSTAFPAARL